MFKHFLVLWLAVGSILITFMSGVGFSQPVIPDGGFENNGQGWTIEKGVIDTTVFHSGLKSLKVTSIKDNVMIANINLTGFEIYATYKESAWVKSSVPAGASIEIFSQYFGTNGIGGPYYFSQVFNDWTLVEKEVLATDSNLHFRIGLANNGATLWMDDISISLVKTREQNKVYYNNILTSLVSTQVHKDEANLFFADLYQYVEKDLVKVESYLKALPQTIGNFIRLGDFYKEQGLTISDLTSDKVLLQSKLTAFTNADTAYSKALTVVPVTDTQTEKDIRQKQEGVKFSYQATEKRIKELTP